MLPSRFAFLIAMLILLSCLPPAFAGETIPRNDQALAELERMQVPADGFTFVVWGDCRDDKGVFDKVVKTINDLDPAFSIGLGDYVSNGTRKEYDVFLERIEAIEPPLISVIGNHDTPNNGTEIWLKEFGETNFSFDFGDVRFICLENADYVLDADELKFLDEQLQTDKRKMIFAHCPPDYDLWSVHCFKKGSDELLKLIKKYDVDYAFFAHIHLYSELMIGNTVGIVTGGAGAPLYKKFGFGGANSHVVKVTVTPEGISHEFVGIN